MTPGTDLTFASAPLNERIQWAKALAGAGNLVPAGFRDGPNPNPAKILLAVEYGAMLGLHPMAALSGIHVIDGKPTLSAALMSAQVHRAGHQLRITTSGKITGTGTNMGGDFTVTTTLIRADDPKHPFTAVWDVDRAKRAGLWGKGNWAKYPENQMTWRGVSEVTKLGAPEVLLGVWHTPDELGATVDEDGDVIEAEIVEQDHDGPQVQRTMKRDSRTEPGNVKNTEARLREPAVTGPDANPTAAPSGRPGRPRTDPVAGTADTLPSTKAFIEAAEDQQDRTGVANMWIGRIRETITMDALISLRAQVVARGSVILDYCDYDDHTVDQWFNRRRNELQQAAAGEPEPAYDPDELI